MIVKLKPNTQGYPDLSENQPYFVIGIEADDYRLLNDAGKPYLYPPEIFHIIDSSQPMEWITEFGDDGEQYSYPAPLNEVGFFEDLFEQQHEKVSVFWHIVNQTLAKAA
ncbi:MAG: hypothetical protein DM484_08515 [Candidatus Methylumidiphilus alinenensis]|uniref:Uncharacterized protein n=1 Tax=Candidatus Methylumidiphilus alinenensis TaxID=2202197 RepID=A0A2W4T1Q6_9GAMM|nr:MAG: hypothetical protein DM484_08515 [Candidatus Methylumidiphilus alinenensis]